MEHALCCCSLYNVHNVHVTFTFTFLNYKFNHLEDVNTSSTFGVIISWTCRVGWRSGHLCNKWHIIRLIRLDRK